MVRPTLPAVPATGTAVPAGDRAVPLTCTDARISRRQPAADHPDRVQAGAHLVHPDRPDALDRGDGGQRHVGVLAVQHRARGRRRVGEQGAEERLAARPDQDRARRAPRARAAAGAAPSCGRRSWRTRARGRRRAGRRRCRRPPRPRAAGRARRGPRPPRRRTTRAAASPSEWARQCIATYAAPCSATTSRIRGSASPPETSLTSTAPASSAAAATSWRIVSTETATPSAASARITGTTRASSSATSGRVAPGRVDSPPMSSRSAPCGAQLRGRARSPRRWWRSGRRRRRSRG